MFGKLGFADLTAALIIWLFILWPNLGAIGTAQENVAFDRGVKATDELRLRVEKWWHAQDERVERDHPVREWRRLTGWRGWAGRGGEIVRARYRGMGPGKEGWWVALETDGANKPWVLPLSRLNVGPRERLKRIWQLQPQIKDLVEEGGKGPPPAILDEVVGLAKAEEPVKAVQQILVCLKRRSNLERELHAPFRLGMFHSCITRDFGKAEEAFGECLRRDKEHIASLNNRAISAMRSAHWSRVVRLWTEALETAPDNVHLRYNLARIYAVFGRQQVKIPHDTQEALANLAARHRIGGAPPPEEDRGWRLLLDNSPETALLIRRLAWHWADNAVGHLFCTLGEIPIVLDGYLDDLCCFACNGTERFPCPNPKCYGGRRVYAVEDGISFSIGTLSGKITAKLPHTRHESTHCRQCAGRGWVLCPHCVLGIDPVLFVSMLRRAGITPDAEQKIIKHFREESPRLFVLILVRTGVGYDQAKILVARERIDIVPEHLRILLLAAMLKRPQATMGMLLMEQLTTVYEKEGYLPEKTVRDLVFSPPEAGDAKYDALRAEMQQGDRLWNRGRVRRDIIINQVEAVRRQLVEP